MHNDAASWVKGLAWASFFFYVAALILRLRRPSIAASVLWTLAFAFMVIHVAGAFHVVHHWSHRAAYEDTARQTMDLLRLDWGWGVFVNYALLVVWAADIVRWWRGGFSKATQAFLAFMWFNGAIIFSGGGTRWFGIMGFALLACAWLESARNTNRG